jgi:ankyrin
VKKYIIKYSINPLKHIERHLMISLTKVGDLARIQEHLNNGVDVNIEQCHVAASCLHVASNLGHLECVKLLLDNQANPNHRGPYGHTPLHVAVHSNKIECIKLLLEHGADPNIQIDPRTVTGYIGFYLGKMLIMPLLNLIMFGTDNRLYRGLTPLHYAAWRGNEECITLLLAHNADRSIRDEYDRTPLNVAFERGDQNIIQLLRN